MSNEAFKARQAALAQAAKESGADQTKAQAGGGDFEPLAAGPCRLRLISYIELGKHEGSFQGKPKKNEKVMIQFEVSGPKHPPRVDEDGKTHPNIITITENLSMSDKARFFNLFGKMNYKGTATHTIELVGEAYLGTIYHRKYAKKGEAKDKPETWTGVAVELRDAVNGYSVRPPRVEDIDTGEYKAVPVAPALADFKAFLWNFATLDDWNSLFIDGTYPERKNEKGEITAPAKSKNMIQATIKSAINFKGSPLETMLLAGGAKLDIDDAEKYTDGDDEGDDNPAKGAAPSKPAASVPTGAAADDLLNGVV